jgi:hypothetical protein
VSLPNDLCKTFPFFKDLRGVISSLEAFASQFTSLEAEKVRLQEEAKSSSSKLDGAIKKAAIARQEVDSLKDELSKLKERLKEEEARAAEKDELLRQSALALLGKLFHTSLVDYYFLWIRFFINDFLQLNFLQKPPASLLLLWTKFRATPRQMVCRWFLPPTSLPGSFLTRERVLWRGYIR